MSEAHGRPPTLVDAYLGTEYLGLKSSGRDSSSYGLFDLMAGDAKSSNAEPDPMTNKHSAPTDSLPGQKLLLVTGVLMFGTGLLLGFLPASLGPVLGKLHNIALLQATFCLALSSCWAQIYLDRSNAVSTAVLLVLSMWLNVAGVTISALTGSPAQVYDNTLVCTLQNTAAVPNYIVAVLINLTDLAVCTILPLLFGVLAGPKSDQRIPKCVIWASVVVVLIIQPLLLDEGAIPVGSCPFALKHDAP